MAIKNLLKTFAVTTLGVLMAGVGQQQVMAASMTATLTADNHYALFTGNESGTEWNFIGRNEKGARGIAQKDFVYNPDGSLNSTYIGNGVVSGDVANGGAYNWSMPETWTYDVKDTDYLYVAVWDDASVNEGWIGEFISDQGVLLSEAENWEFIKTITTESNSNWGINPGDNGDTPELADLSYQVAMANAGENNNWSNAIKKGDNGVRPWGNISDISSEADFLYTTTNANNIAGGNNEKYTIFRTKLSLGEENIVSAKTPEPGFMLGITIFGLLSLRTKLRKLNSKSHFEKA